MNDELKEFWHATWTAWRSGALSAISDAFEQSARGQFDDFLKSSAEVKNPFVEQFFAKYPPRMHEYLIGFSESEKQLAMALTNQRLWMYDKQTQDYVNIDLADIAEFQSKAGGWTSHQVMIRLKDNSERTYQEMDGVPTDEAVRFAIERYNDPDGWSITPLPAKSGTKEKMSFPKAGLIGAGVLLGLLLGLFSPHKNLLTIGGAMILGALSALGVGNTFSKILSRTLENPMPLFRKRIIRLIMALIAYEVVFAITAAVIVAIDPILSIYHLIPSEENITFFVLQFFIILYGWYVWTGEVP